AEAVNTACYVQNRVLVNKSQNKTPYEIFNGRTPAIGFLKPFGYHVMILNTLDHLGKFEAKGDEGIKEAPSQDVKKDVSSLRYIALPNWFHEAHLETSTSNAQDAYKVDAPESSGNSNSTATLTNPPADQMETLTVETLIPIVSSPVPTACLDDSPQLSSDTRLISKRVTSQDDTPSLDNILTLTNSFEDILGVTTNTGELNFFLGLQVLQKKDGIFLSQDKYVGDILKRHQVTPKECHLHDVKRIFRYLKGHPKLGIWYPKDSPFNLVAYSDSDYGGVTQDKKSTTGGCQFFGRRLISWQCKKQKIMATSTTKVEYVAAASGCGQVMWIQNQLLDYGYNFMNTKNYIHNSSAICIV
nr:putative ribonuclease H-like domain-containing protein [Tanacetum cinerariifolium]